jgi:hypothetical protein
MIIFNTIKAAEHWVKFCNRNRDFNNGGWDWSNQTTYIQGQYVIQSSSGDGCGCGCDMYRYNYTSVVGRIKKWNIKKERDIKLKTILDERKD